MVSTVADPRSLMTASSFTMDDGRSLAIDQRQQRAWSRVGFGRLDGEPVFVKQFVDRWGKAHRVGFDGEVATAADLARTGALPAGVLAIPAAAVAGDDLITVSPVVDLVTWDDMTYRRSAERRSHAAIVGAALDRTLRHRSAEGRARTWKGLEAKNFGALTDPDGRLCGCCAVFDLGPPVTGPVSRAGARVVAYAFASPLARRVNADALLTSSSMVLELVRPLAWSTTTELVDEELSKLMAHRVSVGRWSNRLFVLAHDRYRARAVRAWAAIERAEVDRPPSAPPETCPHHHKIIISGGPG